MVHIKDPLQLFGKVPHVVAAMGFLSCYLNAPLSYNRKSNVLSASLNKTFPSFLHVSCHRDLLHNVLRNTFSVIIIWFIVLLLNRRQTKVIITGMLN